MRDLIRHMSNANPLWGAPMHPRRTAQGRHRHQSGHGRPVDVMAAQGPLPNLAEFSALPDIAAIDMFVITTAIVHDNISGNINDR
jgi:hypothetical protein